VSKSETSRANYSTLVKFALVRYADSQKDGAGVAYVTDHGTLEGIKFLRDVTKVMFKQMSFDDRNTVILHTRTATSGAKDINSCHPFFSNDYKIAVMHNGILYDYEKIRSKQIEDGHKFNSKVDSEILLHAYEDYGDEFINELVKQGLTGSGTIVVLLDDGTLKLWTNNNWIELYKNGNDLIGFSDTNILEKYFPKIKVEEETIYTIKNGKIISKQKTAEMKGYASVSNFVETWSRGKDSIETFVDENELSCPSCLDNVKWNSKLGFWICQACNRHCTYDELVGTRGALLT
jgi:glucosamine 6-phosphate synthetase-like amidotransferase/phosphosugar isomerase protein